MDKDFKPFFFEEDLDYWQDEAEYIGDNLKVEDFIDDYDNYEDFINDQFIIPLLGAPGNIQEAEELIKYFEINWPKKAYLAQRIFNKERK